MFKLTKHILKRTVTLAIGIAALFLGGCTESDVPAVDDEVPEGMVKVSLLLPDYDTGSAQFSTRAFDTSEEGYMSNLYVVAIRYEEPMVEYDDTPGWNPINEEDRKVFVFSLNPVGVPFKLSQDIGNPIVAMQEDYHMFNVTLYPGKYKFGVVANVDLYLSSRATKISDFTKESELEDIVLNFSEDTPLTPRHLPMVCLPENMKYSNDETGWEKKSVKDVDNNLITITETNSTRLWADMDFLCAKVRYTILFDKTENGISSLFGSSWIRFNVDDQNKPTATYIRSQTPLRPNSKGGGINENPFITSTSNNNNLGSWIMSIDRFNWHEEGADYPKSPNSTLEPWTGTTTEWIPQEKKVWQGVVYLPENLGDLGTTIINENEENVSIYKTLLKFPYHTKANDQDDTPEKEGASPKEIWLFGNPDEKYYMGSTDSKNYGEEVTDPFEGIQRDIMYDVVAKVTSPDVDQMDIKVMVSILPWHEEEQDLNEDWLYKPQQGANE